MTINVWGRETPNPLAIVNDGGEQASPAIADLAGAEFAVAWVDGNSVTLKFFDEQGNINPAFQQALLTDGVGTDIKDLHLAGGGSGMGYGAVWSETNGGVAQLKLRYFDGVAGAVRGDEIALSTNAAVNQHDVDISAYGKNDARGRPTVDGFDAVWVEGNGGAHALGAIYVQRFGVPLDARRDPSGPPAASGIDGIRGAGSDAQLLIAASGRDPAVVGLHEHVGGANQTIITWIDASNNINIRAYNDAGTQLNTLGVTANNLNTAERPLAAGAQQHVTAVQGGGFVVAWVSTNDVGNNVLVARVFTPGAAAGTWAASAVLVLDQLDGSSNSIADFSLATLETGGFAVSWNATDNGTQAIFSRTYSSGGVAAEPAATVFHAPADATHVAISGIVGDRYVAVYQDNSTPGDSSNVMARILDPRLDSAGDPIVLNGEGLLLIGDPDFATRGRTTPDVLVGTIGKDQIDGRLANDILDGGLGDDVIAAGGGDDSIDGGGGNDTLILTGRFTLDGDNSNDDYVIDHLGGGLFQITDKRANADGADIVRSMEIFEFVGSATSYTFEELVGVNVSNITPTAWGWTDEDADSAPNANAIPDVDGFIVNPASRAGIQGNASVADSVGEFVAVVWENAATVGADTHIRGQFFDVILAPDSFIPNTLNISDGIGIETNPVVSSGGANSGWGFAWEQRDNASDTTRELRTNFVGPGQLTGPELSVLVEANVDQHDAAIFGSFLDRTLASPVGGSVLPTGMSDGYNVVWVSTHTDGVDGAQPAGYGRIMLQRFEVPLDALGNPGAAVAGGIDGIANLNNAYGTMDAAVWVGDEDANGLGGLFGRNPSTSALHTFETGIVWIAQDGAGHEKVMFRAYDDLGKVINYPAGNNISAGYAVAAGTNAHIVSAGAVNFAIVWITADVSSPSGYTVMGTMLSSAGNGLDGVGFGFGAPGEPFVVAQLPAGFDPATSNFQATGLSGEDSNDLAISWSMDNGATGIDMMAQHVRVALDPVSGIALNMKAEGDVIRVNATAAGNQTDGVVAGLLGDRFVAIYTDNNGSYTDGSDLVARVIDTRDAVNPEPIVGDLVQPGGGVQARRDVIVGTNGNDDILADILNNDGLVDWVYAGMGDDTIQGGPGLKGAAGSPEFIDGGEGNDTAVYTGRLQDYSITVNGDGSLEVIDLRPVQDAQGNPLVHDGIDNLYSIENLKFLDLSNNGASAQTITLGFPGAPPALNPNYDGTPVAWSLTDTTTFKEITVDTDPTPADAADRPAGIVVTNLQDGAGLAWTRNGNQVWAITYDTAGTADPVLLGQNTQLTSGAFSGNSVRDIDVAMSGGLGMTTVWESAVAFAQPVIDAAAAARNVDLTAYNNAVAASNAADVAAATAQAFADTTDASALQIVADAAAQQAGLTDAAALQTQLTAALAADAAVVTAQAALDAATTEAGLTDADALLAQLTAALAADAAVVTAQGALDAATTAAGLTDAAALQTQLTAAQAADAAVVTAQGALDAAITEAGLTDADALLAQLTAAQAADAAVVTAQGVLDAAITEAGLTDADALQTQLTAALAADAAVVTAQGALDAATTEAGLTDAAALQTQLTAAQAADAAVVTAQGVLDAALASQEAVNNDPDATQQQIDAAAQAATDAQGVLDAATTEAGLTDADALQTQLTAAQAADAAVVTAQGALDAATTEAGLTDADALQTQLTAAQAADAAVVTAQGALDAATTEAGLTDAAALQTQLTAAQAADAAVVTAQAALDAATTEAGLTDADALLAQLTAALAADAAVVTAQGALDAAITAAGLTDADALQTQLTAAQAADAAVVTAQGALDAATTEAGLTDADALQTQLTAAQAADAAATTAQAALDAAIAADVAAAAAHAAAVAAAQAETTALNGYYNALAAYQTAVEGDSALHLAFASTNTHLVLDPAGGVPGPGIPGGEVVVVGTDGAGEAVDPVVQGYEIVDVNNDTLEVGFHVGFALKDDGVLDTTANDQYGALMLARYEIPVYDILVDGAGLPILDANGQGQLATDAFGNLIPSTAATFGVGSETAPISLGLDGVRGTADDNQAIVLTDQGLFAANAIPGGAHVIQGRNMTIGSLHDGQLVVSYIGTDEKVHLSIFLPTINETADRETRGTGADVVATGLTTYSQFTVPFPSTFGAVAPGQAAMTVAQQNGSFGVFWAEPDGAGTIKVMGIIYSGAGSNWSPSPVITFKAGLPAGAAFEVASSGVTPGGLEDGFFVSWESAGQGIHGQRFDMTGALVGQQIVVGDPTSGTPGVHSSTGIDDGRMLVGYVDGTSVSAQFLDNREPGVPLIGPRTGAPRDVIVGTVGDDAIDGRALEDQLYGGLGNDFITMGADADIGFGGEGNDTIIGAGGQDQLYGEAGDDLLWGGLSGPAAPFNRDVNTGLVAAGVNAALIATNPGVDVISGGAGNDTISFQGEFGAFNINLATGIVTSDRDLNGSFILEDVIGAMVDDGAGGQIFQFSFDVENATGGIGNDTITGDARTNVLMGLGGDDILTGGGGNDILDGGAGTDRAVFAGVIGNYALSIVGGAVIVRDLVGSGGTDTMTNVERFRFSNGAGGTVEYTLAQLPFAATGNALISDTTPLQGQTLTVDTSSIADLNGLGAFSFQWQRSTNGTSWSNIAGATASSFALPDAPGTDLGQYLANQLRVVVTFTDGAGYHETITSAATGPIGLNYSASASATGVNISGRAGDDYIVGSNFVDRLQGMAGNDTLIGGGGADEFFGGDGNDVMLGSLAANDGNDVFNGGAGDDVMFGGAGDDTLGGGDGFDRADFTGPVGNYLFSTGGLDNAVVTDAVGNEGKDSVRNVEVLRFAGVDYTIVMDASGGANLAVNGPAGQAGSQVIFGLGGADTLFGGGGSDILVSGFGNDTVFGGDGDDFIYQRTDETGRDIVDGGDGTDTYILAGNADVETIRIYTRAEALAAGITNIAANTEIVITRNGTNNGSIIAQLDNIEEIKINSHSIANTGNVGDSVIVIGDFNQTSLHFNTIRVEGTDGSDTIDITGLTSAHRVVFESNGGGDTIVGQVRSQDIFNGVGINDQRITDTASLLPDFGMPDGVGSLVSGRAETAMLVDFTPSRSLFSPAALSADAVIAILHPGLDVVPDHTTVALTPFELIHLPAQPLSDFQGQLSLDNELQHLFAARDGLVS